MTSEESEKLSDYNGQPIGKDRGHYVRFGISKQNYGSPFMDKWYRRGKGGIFEPTEIEPAPQNFSIIDSRKENIKGNGRLGNN